MLRLNQRSVWGSAPQQLRHDPKAGRNTPLARYNGQTANLDGQRRVHTAGAGSSTPTLSCGSWPTAASARS